MGKKLTQEEARYRAVRSARDRGLVFIGFEGGFYSKAKSKAHLSCEKHGPLSISFDKLTAGTGCRLCGHEAVRAFRTSDRGAIESKIQKVCLLRGWVFDGFDGGYIGVDGKANLMCRTHGRFSRRVQDIVNNSYGCPECVLEQVRVRNRIPEEELIDKWEENCRGKGLIFKGLDGPYVSADKTKAIVECGVHGIFSARYSNFILGGSGCPGCANYGFDNTKTAYVYALRSSDGSFIKIGISNYVGQRISKLKKATPFTFEYIGARAMPGYKARAVEIAFHKRFTSAELKGFDGATEWLLFDPLILEELKAL